MKVIPTNEQAEVIGAILSALPDNDDGVSNFKIKELFNNTDIYDYDGTKWEFSGRNLIESIENIDEAYTYLNEIEKITAGAKLDEDCSGYYSGCGCVICDIRDRRGDKRRRVR